MENVFSRLNSADEKSMLIYECGIYGIEIKPSSMPHQYLGICSFQSRQFLSMKSLSTTTGLWLTKNFRWVRMKTRHTWNVSWPFHQMNSDHSLFNYEGNCSAPKQDISRVCCFLRNSTASGTLTNHIPLRGRQ